MDARRLRLRLLAASASVAVGGAAVVAAVTLPALASPGAARAVTYAMRTMGTYAHVVIVTADSAAAAPAAGVAEAALARVDSLMSNWTTTSEVARINRVAAQAPTVVEPEVAVVVAASLRTWTETHGAFDVTVEPLVRLWGFLGGVKHVPTDAEIRAALERVGARRVRFDAETRTIAFSKDGVKIDLGGIAKGYAVAVAAESLRARGVVNGLVDLSGNMAAIGHPAGSDRWRIGIRDPRDRVAQFARLPLADGEAISTSGQYEQFVAQNGKTYGHILDPRTGRPVEGLISVTVVARSPFTTDAWDTPLFVLGPREARRLAHARDDLAVVLVQPGSNGVDTVWVESALRDRFQLEPQARAWFHVAYF